MSENEEPPAKLLKADNDDGDATDISNLSDGSLADTTEMPADNLPESMGMVESVEGTEMIEERLQDSLESQEAPEGQESQEEWLSEGVLTDDDFNPAAETTDFQASQTENSQTDSPAATTEPEQQVPEITEPEPKASEQTVPEPMESEVTKNAETPEQNIEEALNTLEGGPEKEVDLNDLDSFLVKKTNTKTEVVESKAGNKPEEDDGNDTDDLLRMLGEDGTKTKKMTKTVKDMRNATKVEPASSDDDDFVYEGASKKLKLAKSLANKVPVKAEPEELDGNGSDMSSDEMSTMQKMFGANNKKTSKPDVKPPRTQQAHLKNIINVRDRPNKERIATSTPLRPPRFTPLNPPVQVKREPHTQTYSRQNPKPDRNPPPLTPAPAATPSSIKSIKQEPQEPEESRRHDDYPLEEEEFESDYEYVKHRQRTTKPEQMDEEFPSDAESHSEDGSLYDELPSSESEDAEDWFQLDIRAEKAGDYLPLLGVKAKEMLLEEKKRVAARLLNLKQSLAALTDSGKKQAEQVRTATMALAELDDMLKAS